MGNFRTEAIETIKEVAASPEGFVKVYTKTNNYLPVDIDIKNRYGIFCAKCEHHLEEIHNLEVRKDDVWVISMPKSGTTWMLEMVWLLVNNLDYEKAMETDQRERCRYVEYVAIKPSTNSIEEVKKMKSPRVIKSHLPMHMLPKALWTVKPKIVYVTRDPKDAIVSFYHFVNGLGVFKCSVDVFVNECVKDKTLYSPFWSHVGEFWKLRNEPYVNFTSFERMKRDLRCEVLKVSKFLGKSLTEEQLNKLVEHLSFEKMKDNESCNNVKEVRAFQKYHGVEEKPMGVFIRKGQVGSYKEDLNPNLIKALEDWTERSTKLQGINPVEVFNS